jgi:hypothetical protein
MIVREILESATLLRERREADLYHSTQEYEEILNSGFIEPMENEEDLETGADDKPAISLTRDKNMNIFGPVQFVIDQTKLANTHKIRPIDAVFTRWGDGEDELERRSESEERVYKPIPMSYIKAIRIVEPEYVDIEDIVELAAKHNLPVIDVNDNPVTENIKESATAGSTAAGNIATVASVPAAYRKVKRDKNGIPKAPQALNKDGTAKNAIDTGLNLMGGKPIKR